MVGCGWHPPKSPLFHPPHAPPFLPPKTGTTPSPIGLTLRGATLPREQNPAPSPSGSHTDTCEVGDQRETDEGDGGKVSEGASRKHRNRRKPRRKTEKSWLM